MKQRPIVIKLGGSLLALRYLQDELLALLDSLGTHRVVLLTGGGPAVKALHQMMIRAGQAKQQRVALTEAQAHWQCIKLMGDLTRTLAEAFPNAVTVSSWAEAEKAWEVDRVPWFIVEPFLRADEKQRDRLPATWDVSSDSIAAHLALRHQAELILLKACSLPKRAVLATTLAKRGVVDRYFPTAIKKVKHWSVRNLPGGTLPEIALDLSAPVPGGRSRRKPARGQR